MQLNYDQIATLAYNAGFRGQDIPIAVAVAQAESGGDTNNSSTAGNSPPSTDRGLMQFNSYWNSNVPDSVAYDPVKAMQAAVQTVKDRGWRDWVTFTKGAYQQFMPAAQAAAAKVNSGHLTPIAGVAMNASAPAPGATPAPAGTPVPQVPQSLQAVGGALSAAAGPWNVSPRLAQAYVNTTGGGAMGGSVPNLPAPPAARAGVSAGRGPIGRLAAALVKPPR